MSSVVLMYHDVIEGDDFDASGFPGAAAASYKMPRALFELHLTAIADAAGPSSVHLAGQGPLDPGEDRVLLTFDDGGVSAVSTVAPLLAKRGWKGHFFVATDWIGRTGFLTAEQILELHHQGHVLGTHSCSHPARIDRLAIPALSEEWRRSRGVLSELINEDVLIGSVPGGHYSRGVAEAAAAAGLRTLFTSEPTSSTTEVSGCLVLGRYHLRTTTSARAAGQLIRGDGGLRLLQGAAWAGKKAARKLAAPLYAALRDRVLSRRASTVGK